MQNINGHAISRYMCFVLFNINKIIQVLSGVSSKLSRGGLQQIK